MRVRTTTSLPPTRKMRFMAFQKTHCDGDGSGFDQPIGGWEAHSFHSNSSGCAPPNGSRPRQTTAPRADPATRLAAKATRPNGTKPPRHPRPRRCVRRRAAISFPRVARLRPFPDAPSCRAFAAAARGSHAAQKARPSASRPERRTDIRRHRKPSRAGLRLHFLYF